MNFSISTPLSNYWMDYRKEVKACRNATNYQNIHALRVATQRLEAIVKISSGLISSKHGNKLIGCLKKTRKCLGPLRDLQVEFEGSGSKTKGFLAFLLNERQKAERKVCRHLDNISLKREKHLVDEMTIVR